MANTKIRIAAVGSKSDGINEINPRFQAEALRNIRGIDCGVLDNSFYSSDGDPYGVKKDTNANFMFKLTVEEDKVSITVGRGMATAYGYDFQTEEDITITSDDSGHSLTSTSGATQYCFVYLEWDLSTSPNAGDIKVHNNGTASIWRSLINSNANLIENPTGVYKLPIYRFTVTSTGIDSGSVVSWEDMNLCPTITRPQVAEVARFAPDCDEDDATDKVANTRFVQKIFDENLQKIQAGLDALYKSFDSGEFTILGVPTICQRENGLVYIYPKDGSQQTGNEPDRDYFCSSIYNLYAGVSVGVLPKSTFNPQKDINVRINTYYWLTDAVFGNIAMYITITTSGNIVMETAPQWQDQSLPAKFAYYDDRFNVGYKCNAYEEPTVWDNKDKYAVTFEYDDSIIAYYPKYYESGDIYTFTAKTKEYSKQILVTATNEYLESIGAAIHDRPITNADGTFSFMSAGADMVVTLTTRWYDGGTPDDE